MGALVPFVFENRELRALSIDGNPWFVAGDAAGFLAHRDAANLTRLLDEDEKGRHIVSTLGGDQEVSIISEAGLYRGIAVRRATTAIPEETRAFITRFQRWVFHDVLPAIRRTGAYAPEADRTDLSLRLVAECRQTFDARAARGLWRDLGLPPVQFEEPRAREDRVVTTRRSIRPQPAPPDLAERAERLVRAAGPAGMTRTALYRRLDGVCRSSQLDAAMADLTRAGRVTATRPVGASIGRPQTTYRWCAAAAATSNASGTRSFGSA